MLIRPLKPHDQSEWLRLRRVLWPACSEAMHLCEMKEYANSAGARAVFVMVCEDGRLGGFAEVSLRPCRWLHVRPRRLSGRLVCGAGPPGKRDGQETGRDCGTLGCGTRSDGNRERCGVEQRRGLESARSARFPRDVSTGAFSEAAKTGRTARFRRFGEHRASCAGHRVESAVV